MSWRKLVSTFTDPEQKDILCAWLHFAGAESLLEFEDRIEAYCSEDKLEAIVSLLNEKMPEQEFKIEILEQKNWNEEWESNFDPVDIGPIHIRAEFHPPSDKREIIISPKMAFGTGHHETTFMMINELSNMDLKDKRVLDYGCGTGILSVMAFMQGAAYLEGVDIQEEAIENSEEHFSLNKIEADYDLAIGDLEQLKSPPYDLVLANINRNVLEKRSKNLYDIMKNNSRILISGILKADKDLILNMYANSGFKHVKTETKGEWCLFVFEKSL